MEQRMTPIRKDKSVKILIVDDEPKNIQMVASTLQHEGYQMAFAKDGISALAMVRNNEYDLILLDIIMPGMDGLEICRTLKGSMKTRDIPVIFLTVKDNADDILKGFGAGAADYMTKPFNSMELLARVRTHVELKKKKDNEKELISRFTTALMERRKAEKVLRESEAKFRLIFDKLPIGAALSSVDYCFCRVNEAMCRMMGYSEKEFKSLSFMDITHRDYLDTDIEQVRRLASGEIDQYMTEKRYVRKDGSIIWGQLTLRAIRDAAGHILYYLPLIVDITERKRVEDELLKTHKLESIGILAGGIAHDFNNLLAGIMGYIDFAQTQLKPQDKIYQNLEKAEKLCLQASELAKRLITFSRGGTPLRTVTSLAELLREECDSAVHGSNVRCNFSA